MLEIKDTPKISHPSSKGRDISYPILERNKTPDYIDGAFQMGLLDRFETKEFDHNKPDFTFIDLFAGIGGFHLAASNLGGKCVFASECDDNARKTYEVNFLKHNKDLFYSNNFAGDITEVDEKDIPSFDFLFAGFPLQSFFKGNYYKDSEVK